MCEKKISTIIRNYIGLTILCCSCCFIACESEREASVLDDDDDDSSDESGSDLDMDIDGDADGDGDGDGDDCDEWLELIYLVDEDNSFYTFDPEINSNDAFQQVGDGPLTCPSGGQPFSMSVGRDGYAYVLFVDETDNGFTCNAINKIDVHTGDCEGATPFVCGTEGFDTFGMGYVTDGENTEEESLYIGTINPVGTGGKLAVLDVSTGEVSVIGELEDGGPEFTGNARGELWGFFPEGFTPFVAQIDKSSGATVADTKTELSDLFGGANAWAFAHWGGDYYLFYKRMQDPSTIVYRLRDGTLETHLENTGKTIVGAGVSTCAPIIIE